MSKRFSNGLVSVLALALVTLAVPTATVPGTAAAAVTIKDYAVPSPSAGLGNFYWRRTIVSWNGELWFTETNVNKLGHITTAGKITEEALPEGTGDPGNGPEALSVGSDGLWFISDVGGFVGVLRPGGQLSMVTVPTLTGAGSLVGDTGGVWMGDFLGDGVIHTTPGETKTIDTTFERPAVLARGPDGAIWLGDDDGGQLQRLTAAGEARAFPLPGPCRPSLGCSLPGVTSLVTGPDGKLWYTRSGQRTITSGMYEGFNRSAALVGRMTTGGSAKEWELVNPKLSPHGIVAGPDRALWFVTDDGLGRVDTRGRVRLMELPGGRTADSIAFGPDGAIWFTDARLNRVSRIAVRDAQALGGPLVASRALRVRGGRIPVALRCPPGGSACSGRLGIGTDRALVASASYRIRAGRSATVAAKPTRAGVNVLRGRGALPVTVTIAQSGGRDGDSVRLTLRR